MISKGCLVRYNHPCDGRHGEVFLVISNPYDLPHHVIDRTGRGPVPQGVEILGKKRYYWAPCERLEIIE